MTKEKSRFQADTSEGRLRREEKSLMRRRQVTFYLVSLLGLSVWVSCSTTQEEGAGSAPDTPQIEISSYTDILPAAQKILDGATIQDGEKIFLISDRSIHPAVNEAFQRLLPQEGALVDFAIFDGDLEVSDQGRLWELARTDLLPPWVWEAMKTYDRTIFLSYLSTSYTVHEGVLSSQWLRENNVRTLRVGLTPSQLAYQPFVEFPAELAEIIVRKTIESLPTGPVSVRLTDLEGTDLTYEANYDELIERYNNRRGGSPGIGYSLHADSCHCVGESFRNVTGVIVSSYSIGPIPPIRLELKDNQIVNVEGGGGFDAWLTSNFEENKDIEYEHAIGANWLEEVAFQTHPKFLGTDSGSFSAVRLASTNAEKRSGVIHFGFGSLGVSREDGVLKKSQFHIHLLNFFSTLVLDGQTIIDEGHLVALDDPEVIELARKYGDPEDLLREDWVHTINSVLE